jgi:hypothetical protein
MMLNSETAPISHIFAAPLMSALNAGNRFFDHQTGRFDPVALEKAMGPWSSGERIMASLALALWSYPVEDPRNQFDVNWATNSLSSDNLLVCLEAIAIRGRYMQFGEQLVRAPKVAE